MADESPRSESTVCPLCAVGCRLSNGDEERAVGRTGPANPAGRLCEKGIQAFETTKAEDRLTAPMVRQDGELVEVPWDRAYERVVNGIEDALRADGPDALAFLGAPNCTTEENYLLQKLARTLGTNNVDNRARHCHVSVSRTLERRLGWRASTNSLDDLQETDVILVVGANPAERQPVAFNSFVRPTVLDGATLIHVDPVANRTTRLANIHLAPPPCGDAFLLHSLCARVLEDGNEDEQFIASRTTGFEDVVAAIEEMDVVEGSRPAAVDEDSFDRAATEIGTANRVSAIVGTGIEDGDGEEQSARSLLNLLLLTGNVGRPGTGLFVFRGPANEQGAIDAGCVPDRLPGHQPVTDGTARERVESEWGVQVPETVGQSATELLAGFGRGIRAAVVVGVNPAVSKRDREWVHDRLAALETLVVLEVSESETTDHADVVVPAATGLEKTGTLTNLDRRVQRLTAVSEPPEDVRTDLRILADIARRLSAVSWDCYSQSAGDVFEELTRVSPIHRGMDYAHLDGNGSRWPTGSQPVLYRDAFETPDGRASFEPVRHVAHDSTEDGYRLVVGGRAGDADAGKADDALGIHPSDAKVVGIDDGQTVVVSSEGTTVETVARLDASVRQGTVYMHATRADPFVREGTSTVTLDAETVDSDAE